MKIPKLEDILNNTDKFKKPSIKKNYPEFYEMVNKLEGYTFPEKLYNYYHPNELHKCLICHKTTNFINFKKGYSKYCSCKCSRNSELVKDVFKQTCIKKYGVENPSQNKEIKNKISKSNKITQNNPNIKEKINQTNLERYGVVGYNNREKFKMTSLKKYGVENPFQSDAIKEKIRQANLKRYGEPNHSLYISKQNHEELIGYTSKGDWICKCPHPECNKCKEKFYTSKSSIQYDRVKDNNELCTKLFPIGSKENRVSNSSQTYFDQLNQYFSDSIYYKKSEYEYKVGKYSLDFYIPSIKVDIEFNGILYHMKPSIYKPADINPINNKTAQEIWDHDKERKEYIESKGIKVIVVWEDDLPNPKKLYEKLRR